MIYRYVLYIFLFVVISSCKNCTKSFQKETLTNQKSLIVSDSLLLDPSQSLLYWRGNIFNNIHNGFVHFISGCFMVYDNQLIRGEAIVALESLHCLDVKEMNALKKLEHQIKSDTILETRSFPYAKFTIFSVQDAPNSDSTSILTGLLTIKNIPKPVKINAIITSSKNITMITIPKFKIDPYDFILGSPSKVKDSAAQENFQHDSIELNMKIMAKSI